jgi:hypothetical protein
MRIKNKSVFVFIKFIAAVNRRSKAMLDNIITMDKTMVSYHTPETKKNRSSGSRRGSQALLKPESTQAGSSRC